jgi:hypothetical protein
MAYPQPEFSPAKAYLGMDRRHALAEQIDAAILCRYRLPYVTLYPLCGEFTHPSLIQTVRLNLHTQMYLN